MTVGELRVSGQIQVEDRSELDEYKPEVEFRSG